MNQPVNYLKKLEKVVSRVGTISLILISVAVFFTIYMLQQASVTQRDQSYIEEVEKRNTFGKFDQRTIEKIQRLQKPSEARAIQLPEGRINPFSTE